MVEHLSCKQKVPSSILGGGIAFAGECTATLSTVANAHCCHSSHLTAHSQILYFTNITSHPLTPLCLRLASPHSIFDHDAPPFAHLVFVFGGSHHVQFDDDQLIHIRYPGMPWPPSHKHIHDTSPIHARQEKTNILCHAAVVCMEPICPHLTFWLWWPLE